MFDNNLDSAINSTRCHVNISFSTSVSRRKSLFCHTTSWHFQRLSKCQPWWCNRHLILQRPPVLSNQHNNSLSSDFSWAFHWSKHRLGLCIHCEEWSDRNPCGNCHRKSCKLLDDHFYSGYFHYRNYWLYHYWFHDGQLESSKWLDLYDLRPSSSLELRWQQRHYPSSSMRVLSDGQFIHHSCLRHCNQRNYIRLLCLFERLSICWDKHHSRHVDFDWLQL